MASPIGGRSIMTNMLENAARFGVTPVSSTST